MPTYRHLTQNERYMMANLDDNDYAQREIAHLLRRSPSTISREIRRNGNAAGYHAGKADAQATRRRWDATSRTISDHQWALIEDKIRQDWSPEQISGWLAREGKREVSHEWIYQYIYRDQADGGPLHTHLRCRKKRRTRYGTYQKRGPIPDRVSITERPAIVENRDRLGDWEGDTIRDPSRQQAIVRIMHRLNTRPRKCLDYQTPAEVFYANQEEPRVALRT